MDQFDKYQKLWQDGSTAYVLYTVAVQDGLDFAATIRMLRHVCGLSLVEAKEVSIVASGRARSLATFQASLIPALEHILNQKETPTDTSEL